MPVKKHLGFKKTQAKIAKKQGISKASAGAILASSARKASPAAVKKNPALKNVPGVKKYVNGGWVQEVIKTAQDRKKKEGNKTISSSRKSTEEKLGNDTYRMNKAFRATKSGKLISEATQDYPTRGGGMLFDKTTTVMDTTGYSKGKKSFPAKRTNYNPFDTDYLTGEQREVKTQTFDVPRNKVKKTIKEMKANTGMLQKEKKAKAVKKPATSTKTMVDRYGNKTTKAFKPVAVNKSEAFREGGKNKNPALKNVPGVKKYNIGGSFARAISGKKVKDTMEKTGYQKIVSRTPATPESRKAFIKKMEDISTSNSGKVTKLTPGQGSGLNKATSKNIAKPVPKAKNVTKEGKVLRGGSASNSKLKKSIEVDANASGYKNGVNVNTNEKGRINSVYNRRKGTLYNALPNGVVAAETKGYSQAIDTTGFSAGKTSFPTTVKKSTVLPGGIKAKKVTRYETSRSNVLPTVQKMKKSVMSPTPNVKKQKDLANPKTLSSKSRLMRKGGKK